MELDPAEDLPGDKLGAEALGWFLSGLDVCGVLDCSIALVAQAGNVAGCDDTVDAGFSLFRRAVACRTAALADGDRDADLAVALEGRTRW